MTARNSLAICVALFSIAAKGRAQSFDWQPATAASQGMSQQRLEALQTSLAARNTKALLIIRHDRIVLEHYAPDHAPDKPHYTASLAKSLIGGMSLALAIQDDRLKPEDPASRFIPQWRDDPRKSKITIAHLATHTSGLEDAEENKLPHEQLTGWKGDFWKRQPDPFSISRDKTPVLFDPGHRIAYSNPGMAMLSYAITAALKDDANHKDVRTLLRDRIMRPIGVPDKEWSCGYNKTYDVDGLPLVPNWGGGAFTARATARVALLILRNGDWQGQKILDEKILRTILHYNTTPRTKNWSGQSSPQPVLAFYSNIDKTWPTLPRDAFCGGGAGHQLLLAVPSLDLIVIRYGGKLDPKQDFWAAAHEHLFAPAVAAIADPPIPPSDVIRAVHFDPPETIIRKALDSDNWPITWADDDALYTSYGDGKGFEPFIEKKLSLGLAKITGDPANFRAENLRAPTIERTGDGPKGPKASGLLATSGTLYMWIRNTSNSQLAWSTDNGQTWQWGFKFENEKNESFGCPTFLNAGKNYADAQDDYVYTYSQDGPTAYQPYDGVVLARVPKDKMKDRTAYEFFTGAPFSRDPKGSATWSRRIEGRAHTLSYPNHCERLDVIYNPALKRYLLTMGYGHGQGWGLYDAPTPHGPWTTAFTTKDWHQGETHGYRLPTKWISKDGTRMYLIFSGRKWGQIQNDAFCLRGMILDLYP